MITVLNFCNHDRDQALNLLRWIGELGGVSGHELILQGTQQVAREGLHTELISEAKKSFASVEYFMPYTEDERGWPQSPNHAWQECVIHMRELFAKRPAGSITPAWLWIEPDCVPLRSTWLDELEDGYKKAGKPFFAAEVLHPRRRLSGIAIYPAMVNSYLMKRRMSDLSLRSEKGEAWDVYFSPEWIEFTHFTNLIQNTLFQSRNPDSLPTFSDHDSMSLIHPAACLFHRCKDRTLIDRLRAQMEQNKRIDAASVAISTNGSGGSGSLPEIDAEKESLRQQLEEMKRRLEAHQPPAPVAPAAVVEPPKRSYGKRIKQKRVRTPEQIAADHERMAKVRAGRKVAA